MSKSDVISLVTTFALDQDNTTETSVFYDEIVRELGFLDVLTGTEVVDITAGIGTYEIAPSTIRAIEFYSTNNGFLTKADSKGLGSLFGAAWRTKLGTPIAVSMDDEDDDEFRLVPKPDSNDSITIIRTESRTDVPVWLELPIVFEILGREFYRESDHQDLELSSVCTLIAGSLFKMVGVK